MKNTAEKRARKHWGFAGAQEDQTTFTRYTSRHMTFFCAGKKALAKKNVCARMRGGKWRAARHNGRRGDSFHCVARAAERCVVARALAGCSNCFSCVRATLKTFVARRRGVWTRANMEETRAHVCFFSRALGEGDGPGARGDLRVAAAAPRTVRIR